MKENFDNRSINHSASVQVVFRAISSDSIVLLAITVCLQDFQDTNNTKHKYIPGSRLYVVGVNDPVGSTIPFYNIRISSVSQTITNCASKISEYSI